MKTRSCALGLALLVSIVGCFPGSRDDESDDSSDDDPGGEVSRDDDGDDDDDVAPSEPGTSTPGTTTPSSPSTPKRALGTVVIRVYRPSGACESDDPSTAMAFNGQMYATMYDQYDRVSYAREPVNGEPRFKFPAYKDYTFKNTNEVTWELSPDKKGSYPTACLAKGKVTITTQGETKNVTIWD